MAEMPRYFEYCLKRSTSVLNWGQATQTSERQKDKAIKMIKHSK